MAWATTGTTDDDRERMLGRHTTRVHMVEYAWLARIQTAQVFAYRFHAAEFKPYGSAQDPHALVAEHPVVPLGPAEPVGDLLALHEAARIEVRLTHSLWSWWEAVSTSTLGFSGVRLRNASRSRAPEAWPEGSAGR